MRIVRPSVPGTPFHIMPAAAANKSTILLRLAREGPVRARDLGDIGIPRAYLKRFCDRLLFAIVGSPRRRK